MGYTLTLPFVRSATAGFVKADQVREILSLSLVSGKNCILFGPGGHGKSEMTAATLAAITGAKSRTQMFGEGMDEARLYGGINLGKLNSENPVIEYHPERSFLSWDFAVFEELFDAPTSVLMTLKDTLTSKGLRNGEQQFPMRTQSIVCATNREPGEVAEIGAAAQALIERFPLQLRVAWESYSSSDYLEMFRAVGRVQEPSPISLKELEGLKNRAKAVVVPESVQRILAEMIANAVASGVTISPRSAMYAQDLVRASAVINNRSQATKDDIQAIKYLPGCDELAAKISEEIEAAVKRAEAEGKIRDAESRLRELQHQFQASQGSPIRLLQVAVQATSFGDSIANMTVTDNLTQRRKSLRDATSKLASEAQASALSATRV